MNTDTVPAPVGHIDGETLLRQEDMLDRLRADRNRLVEEVNSLREMCDSQRITIGAMETEMTCLRADVTVLEQQIRRASDAETRRVDRMMDAFVSPASPAWHYRKDTKWVGDGQRAYWFRSESPDGPWESCPPPFRDAYEGIEEAA